MILLLQTVFAGAQTDTEVNQIVPSFSFSKLEAIRTGFHIIQKITLLNKTSILQGDSIYFEAYDSSLSISLSEKTPYFAKSRYGDLSHYCLYTKSSCNWIGHELNFEPNLIMLAGIFTYKKRPFLVSEQEISFQVAKGKDGSLYTFNYFIGDSGKVEKCVGRSKKAYGNFTTDSTIYHYSSLGLDSSTNYLIRDFRSSVDTSITEKHYHNGLLKRQEIRRKSNPVSINYYYNEEGLIYRIYHTEHLGFQEEYLIQYENDSIMVLYRAPGISGQRVFRFTRLK